jgi:hypothetical protein
MNIAEIKFDVMELIGCHSHAIDGNDPKAYADLFTEDGTYISRINNEDTIHGRNKKELYEYALGLYKERGDNQPRHHIRNTIFLNISENEVSTATYFLATNVSGKGGLAVVTGTGIYEDEIVRGENGWRIRKRIAVYD